MPVAVQAPAPPGGIKSYYQAKIEAAELEINQKTQNLRRLEAQRNALNARGRCALSLLRILQVEAYDLSEVIARGAPALARAWKLRRGGCEGNGKEQGSSEGATRGEIQ